MLKKSIQNLAILILILLISISCFRPKTVNVPEGLIQPDVMALIYRDIHLTDAYLTRHKMKINVDYIKINGYYKSIYEKYGYSRNIIDSSMAFYSHHPEIMNEIYDQVLIELSKMEDTIAISKKTK